MSVGTIQIPVLFDMSGDSIVYGEDATGADFVDSHLQFLLDMTTEANGISLNASDISSAILVADQDTGDNIFFDGDGKGIGIDNLCNRIAKAITRGKLVHIPSIGNFSNSGIPVGGEKYLYNHLGQIQDPGTYTLKYTTSIAPIGDEQMLGQAMARVASVHLIGDPLGSQAFEDATSVQTSLETASSHTFNQGQTNFYNALAVQLSKVLGGSKSSAPMNPGVLIGTEQFSTAYDLVTTSTDETLRTGSPLTGQVYTSSSTYSATTYPPKYAFDKAYNTNWISSTGTYVGSTGEHNGGAIMSGINGVTTNNNSWDGIWIKADIGETVVLSEYKIYPYQHSSRYGTAPRHAYLLSSPDNINWSQIHELDITDDAAGRLLYRDANSAYIPVTIDLTSLNNREGRYFALVIDKLFSDAGRNYCMIKELQLNGVTKAEFDGGSPPAAYDIASGKANSAYTTSALRTSYPPSNAFNTDTGTGLGWSSTSNSFVSATGLRNGVYLTHTLASGIRGEWLQVDLSQNVNVMQMHLITQLVAERPKEGYLLSSKDGNNWDIVHTLDSNNWVEGTTFDQYEVDISGTPTGEEDIKIGKSWRLLITKVHAPSNGYTRIGSFQLNGIVFPTDFGSSPSSTNEIYTNNVTPYDITSWDDNILAGHSIITNQHYSASSRSNTTTYHEKNAFMDDGGSAWRSASYLYNGTDGLYQHNTWTGPYRGEWIQVDLSENFIVKNYLIEGYRSTHHTYYKSSPKKGYLLSSLDNKRWRLAHTFDISSDDAREFYNATDRYRSIYNDLSNNELSVGRYWRFVVEKVFPGNSSYIHMRNFKLFGVKETEETKHNGQSTNTFIDNYTLTVTPYDLTSNNKSNDKNTVTDLSGVYSSSTLHNTSSYQPFKAFEATDTRWQSLSNHYNTTAPDASGGTYFGERATGPYRGEWVQVDVGETVFADNYIIGGYKSTHRSYRNSSPKKGYLLSSLDGKKWRLAHTFEETTIDADYTYNTSTEYGNAYRDISNNENAIGRYWRFVVEKVFTASSGYASISTFKINGGKHPSEVIQGDITTTTQDNTIYTLNVTPYDLTTHTVSGAEASWGTFNPPSTLTGHVYTSSSYNSSNYYPYESFTTAENTYGWRSIASSYNSTKGTYRGQHMTGPYKGEWVQVDLSENVFADNYLIGGYKSTSTSYYNSSPKKGYLLSSLDNKTWRLVHTFEEETSDYTYKAGTGYGVKTNDISNNKNAIGRYWRFVIEKVFTNNGGYVHMAQFKINGGKYPSEVNVGNGAEATTIKNYTLTETAYDFTSVQGGLSLDKLPVRNENLNNRFSSSSYGSSSYLTKNAFSGYNGGAWQCYGTPYNEASGLYYGSHSTGPYKGEWLQVDLSENYIASSYVLSGYQSNHSTYKASSPKCGYLLSSLDGKTWRLAHTFEEYNDLPDYTYDTSGNNQKYNEITCNDNAIGRYWRFVTEKVFENNSGYVWIQMLTLYGVKESKKIEGVISTDISRNNPGYILNATGYNLTNSDFSVLTGHEYSSSSNNSTTYLPSKAFQQANGEWRSYSQYNATSGTYYGTEFTGPYKGEWLQVDLSENVFAENYLIAGYQSNHASYSNTSPKKGYLLSSLDNKTWRLAHTFEETTDAADYNYTSTDWYGVRINNIPNNENAIGRYWRFVVEKLFENSSGHATIRDFVITGVKYPSQVTVQNLAVDPSLNIVRELPADMSSIYDLVSTTSTITGQAYSASTIHTATTYDPIKAFTNDTNRWSSVTQYNNVSGTYRGNKLTGEYYGEWIQVDIGQNVVIGQYKIHPYYSTHASYFNTAPKKGFLLSSLDGNKWDLVHNFEVASTSAYNYSASDASAHTPVTITLNGQGCKGRYFRFVVNKIFPSSDSYAAISQIEILGVKESEATISSESKVNRYDTFTNNTTPYDIYRRTIAHNITPYLISTPVSSLVPIDLASQNSTISGQSYLTTYGTAQNAFDNSGNTEWSTDASSNYGIISSLITNEPNFSSWAAAADGVLTTFSEDVTVATIDKSNFSIYDTSANSIVPIHSVEISNGKLLVKPLTGYLYNDNVAEYDLTSTSSPLYGTRGEITFTSEYNHNSHRWPLAFDTANNGPALFGSGSWSGRNPVGGVDVVISGVTYHGHWVQLDVGQNVLVKTFEYTPRNNYQANEWDTLLIAGSKDGTTWDLLWRVTDRVQSTAQVKETYAVDATDVYSQFRWLCEKTTGSASYAFNALEITLLGQKESEASLVAFTASKINDYRITYTKPLNQDNQLKGVTNGVGLQSFVLEDGAVTGRGEYAILPLSLNEPSFTSSQLIGGGGWTKDTSVGATKSWWGITSSADGTKLAATVQGGNIWTSTDSGASWTSRATALNWYNGIASSDDGTKLVASANNGKIWTSTDSGANWTERASVQPWNGLASSADGVKLVSVAYNGNIWTSSDSGVNWTEVTNTGAAKKWVEVASSADGTKLAVVVYQGNIWTSTDSGANWTEVTNTGGTKNWYSIASSVDGTKLAAVVKTGNIWTSTDSGANWTEQTTSFGGTKDWRAIASSADGTKLAAAAYGGNLWTSSDSGATWTEDTTVNATKNWRGIASSADGTKLVAGANSGNIWTLGPPTPVKLEYTFSESLQAGAGGFDITDIQLIEPSGNTVDLSSNITGIVGGKLVIGTYPAGFNLQGNNYALSGPSATHSGTVSYSYSTQLNSGQYGADNAFDGDTATRWASANIYNAGAGGTYNGSVSTVTTNAGTINGEWIQVDTGKLSVLNHFTYLKSADASQDPTTSSIAGSIDDSTWTVITSFSYDKDNDPDEVTKNISTQAEYRYYRFIYTAVAGGSYASCQQWTLFGHIKDDYYIGETISDTNYMLVYNKNSTVNKHIIGATNNVTINSFRVDNNLLIGRGGVTNIGQYDGSTSTTLTDTSTYKGEYIQVDVGKNVIINNYAINVKSFNGNDNPKSWMLVGSLNGSDWTKIDEVFNTTLLSNYVGGVTATSVRYLRLIINRGGTEKHIKISEFKVNGVEIKLEGQTYSASLDNGDANTVFDNSITTSWDTSSAYNYNGIDAVATNEATYNSVGLHTDASGNGKIELTFSADLSSNDLKASDFSVTETDFSATIPILADISGGKLLIEKQANVSGSIFYEDFDDQAYLGDVTTADIVQGGIVNAMTFHPHESVKEVQLVNGASVGYNHCNHHTITELNGKYYVSRLANTIDELDPVNNTLTRITSGGARGYAGHALFAYNGLLYIYGGGDNSNYTDDNQLDSYNPSTDTWTINISTSGPAPRFYQGGYALDGNTFYASGGTKDSNTSKLDLTTMAWTTIDTTAGTSRITPHFVYNNRLYRYGRATTWQGRSAGLQYLDLANPGAGWTAITINDPNNLRIARSSGFGGSRRGTKGVAVKDGKMYYVGGWDEYFDNANQGYYTDILHYIDLTTNTAHEIQPGMLWPVKRARHQHFFIGNYLYLWAGGTLTSSGSSSGQVTGYYKDIYKLDITKTATQYGYRLQADNTVPKIWRISDQTFLAISFWFKKSSTQGTIFDSYNSTDSNATYSGGDGQKDRMKFVANKPRLRTRNPANIERWYQNGIQCSTPSASEHHGNDGHTAMATDTWHHIYVEFKTPNDRIQFFANGLSSPLNPDSGSLDEVRFYNTSVSEEHIQEMAQGWNGMYPGASFDKTDYLIEYKKNSSSASHIYDVNNTSVPINDFILRNGSLISRGTNFGHYNGSTTTTLADSSTSTGEYIEVNEGQPTYVTEYELHVPSSNQHPDDNVYPKSWVLLGSTDGSTWSKIHEVTDYTGWTTNSSYGSGYKVNYMTEVNNMVAQYYRLIINKTYGKVGYTSVAELLIKGVKHTSETTGVTQVKTASLGTAADAFDGSVSTGWDTSSSASYGTLASTVTNEPIFSSGTINGSSQIELTFDTNIDISGTFNKSNLSVTNSSFAPQSYNASIDSGKLLLTYSPDQLAGLDTIFFENFNDQTTTDALGNVGSIVAGGHDGLGYALQRDTTNANHTGVCWEQTTIAENIKTIAFWYIIDETDLTGTWNNVLWLYHNTSYTYVLRFASDNHLGQGTSHQGHQVEKYYVDGVLCDGANLVTSYDTDITLSGNAIEESSFQGTWRHIVLEFKDPLNDPNVSNSAVSKIKWLTENSGGYSLKSRIDDIRFYDQALTQAQITTLATNGMTGSFSGSLSDYNIQYTKSNDGNLVNATHTSVDVNSFALIAGTITNRGDDGIGAYTGSTNTTLPDSSTYNGEWIQIDVGQMILMTEIKLVVPNKDAYTNPKSWKVLVSSDNTNWIELLDVTDNTKWDSGFGSASTQFTGFELGPGLANQHIGRYFKIIVNSIIGPSNNVKINEIVIKGVMHTVETDVLNDPYPTLYTATPSNNTTSNDTTVTTKKHNADDTVTTTTVETTVDIASNTVTTTTTKTTVAEVTSAVTLNTATPSSVTTVDSDTTALTTTYNNNDTSVRTIVNKTIDISANTDTTTNLNTIITTTVTGFNIVKLSGSGFDPNKVYDASGVSCPALKSIYEQLMNVPGRSQIMQSRDFTSSPMPSVETITGGFPFISGDKLVMYLRPKIVFAQATFPEQFTTLTGFGGVTFGEPVIDTALASGGAITGQTYTESSKYSDTYAGSKLFDGSTTTFWITASDTYGTDGVATGGSTTIHADDGGGTYTGHYVQIEFANSVAIEDIKITPRKGGGGGAGEPKEFRILSSDDGSTFRVAYSVADGDLNNDWSLWSTQTFHLSNLRDASSKGKYWRIAVGKITTGNKVQLAKVELIGNLTSTLIGNDVGQPVTTGGGGESSTALPSAVGLINQDGTTHSRERGDIANIIDNDDATWSYTTTAFTTSSHGPFITKFSFPAEQVGKILNSVLLSTNSTDNHNMTGIKFGILNGTTYTSLNVTSGTNLGTGSTLTTGTVTWDNDTNWHIESYPVGQETTVNFNDYAIQSNDHLVVRWDAATNYKHFTMRYFKFVTAPSGGVASTTYPTSTLTNGYPTTGSILDISGLETNITKLGSTFPALFPGNTTGGNEAEAQKFGWVGSANADTLSLETTDEKDTRTMDLHIWKITITL